MKRIKLVLSLLLTLNIFALGFHDASAACVFINGNLKYSATDISQGGPVSLLQSFLSSNGYLQSEPTGYFGGLTLAAVKRFQSANGIEATGFVGPLTRAALERVSCGGVTTNPTYPSYPTYPTYPTTPTYNPVQGCFPGALFNTLTGLSCTTGLPPNNNTTIIIPSTNNDPRITVTSPDDGDSFQAGDTIAIRWDSLNVSSNVIIQLRKGSSTYGTISSSIANTGYVTWTIPTSVTAGSDYKIRIIDANNSGVYDNSDGQFSISQSVHTAKSITAFNFTNPTATGSIDETNKTVIITLPFGTAIGTFIPSISVTPNASISPASGVAQNFSTPKDYVVKAENGTTQTYRVTVQNGAATSDKAITSFNFTSPGATGSINESAKTINVSYPVGTAVTSLAPTIIVSPNATVSPLSGVVQNFSTPKTYTVRAQDGTTQSYVVTVSVAQPFLTLTSPNGGNSFQRGTSMHITWNFLGVTNVKVELLNGATVVANIASSASASSGALDYTIPISTSIGSNYKIRVTDTANTLRSDISDSAFNIVENTQAQGFTFSSPSSGSNNFTGKPLTINWTTSGNVPNVGIAVVKGTATTTLVSSVANSGTFTWNVPIGQTAGSDYSIFIYNTTNGNVFAYSPKFNIVNGDISVTSPLSGSNNFVGQPLTIHWTTNGTVSSVGIALVKGTATTTLVSTVSNTGTYTFNVPAGQAIGNDYSIFIYNTANANVSAYSPKFNIVNGTISVTNPSSSSEYYSGKTLPITWNSAGFIPNVGIALVKGTATTTLLSSLTNSGAYTYAIPAGQAGSSDYSVFVYNTTNANVFSYSPKFKITVPNITVTAPSGTTITRGSNMHVTWTATGNVGAVRIELLKGAASVTPVMTLSTSVSASAGAADFIIPTTLTAGSDYYVRITDTASSLTDKNDAVITLN